MKKEILLQEEFVNWFVDIMGYPVPTAKSYCDYIAAADRCLENYSIEDGNKSSLLQALSIEVNAGNTEGMEDVIDSATDELSKEHIEVKLKKSLKYIQNWKSALYQYKEFLHNYMDDNSPDNFEQNGTDVVEIEIEYSPKKNKKVSQKAHIIPKISLLPDDVAYVYTKQDLYKKFHFRITTQDRHYDEIYYPISFITRFLYLKNEGAFLDTWVKEMLSKVIIHTEGGMTTLNKVTKLKIENGKVHVELDNGQTKMILTKKSDNVNCMPLVVEKIGQIALDHETSMYNIMLDNIHEFVTFQEITEELKKFNSGKMNSKKFKQVNGKALKEGFIEFINIDNLKSEMNLISSFTNLQLMHSSENTKKGKQ